MKAYCDSDASLEARWDKTLLVIGYAHQGPAQYLNSQDSERRVIIASLADARAEQAHYPVFKQLLAQAEARPINETEESMRRQLEFKME